MKVLAPYISCALEASDFSDTAAGNPLELAVEAGYTQIFIPTSDGYYKYHVLQPGEGGKRRFVCLKTTHTPGMDFPKVSEGVQFLPAGKIPIDLFYTVKEFFRQVIIKKGRALEAMIWILWNETDGYYLHVPNQRVSHGSATYDWASLPAGSNIVVDIHSHADFKGFFSGTDNADDANSIRFSGVIGDNDKPVQSMEFRFNYLGYRVKVELEDLFVKEVNLPLIDESWFDKVQTTSPYGTHMGGGAARYPTTPYRPYVPGRDPSPDQETIPYQQWVDKRNSPPKTSGMSGIHGALQDLPGMEEESVQGGTEPKKLSKRERRALALLEKHSKPQSDNGSGHRAPPSQDTESSNHHVEGNGGPDSGRTFLDGGDGRLVQIGEGSLEPFTLVRDTLLELDRLCRLHGPLNGTTIWRMRVGNSILSAIEPAKGVLEGVLDEIELLSQNTESDDWPGEITRLLQEEDEAWAQSYASAGSTEPDQDGELSEQAEEYFKHAMDKRDPGDVDDMFDTIAINNGIEVARAFSAMERASVELTKAPELLAGQLLDIFGLVEDDRKLEIFRRMAESLSSRDRDRLATNGL